MFKNFLAHLLNVNQAIQNLATINIHVFFKAGKHGRIRCQLDGRRRLRAKHRPPARRKANNICTTRNLTGDRARVVAWRIHKHKTWLGNTLGVLIHLLQGSAAALHRRAQ